PCRLRFHCCDWVFHLPLRHSFTDKTETFTPPLSANGCRSSLVGRY
uniref:Uncharacterized protein n=1 Tax=Cucumis melo TaxID=3656 RepID=A0A9I9E6A8_CUCME